MYDPGFPQNQDKIPHYYGDVVRVLFVIAAVLMTSTIPFFGREIPISVPMSLLVIAILGLAAGFTNPRQRWIIALDAVIALGGAVAFGYFGVIAYEQYSLSSGLFWTNEALAIIFILALYYSSKTLRGALNR